jgi:hypothetical protein
VLVLVARDLTLHAPRGSGWRWPHRWWGRARGSHTTGDCGLGSDLRGALERITGIAQGYPIGDRCTCYRPSSLLDGVRRFVR